jgi:hypothetical protein
VQPMQKAFSFLLLLNNTALQQLLQNVPPQPT